jgi:hypothetical protein
MLSAGRLEYLAVRVANSNSHSASFVDFGAAETVHSTALAPLRLIDH